MSNQTVPQERLRRQLEEQGYIILEQSQAAVDMLGHRLVHVKKSDLKLAQTAWPF